MVITHCLDESKLNDLIDRMYSARYHYDPRGIKQGSFFRFGELDSNHQSVAGYARGMLFIYGDTEKILSFLADEPLAA
jgi:hypothetical protein